MILSFLEPYEIRGVKAPYLWVFYKQLQDFGIEDIVYVGAEDYFRDPNVLKSGNRWEFSLTAQKTNKYEIPSYNKILNAKKEIIDKDIYKNLQTHFKDNISIWKFLIFNRYKPLEDRLNEIFDEYNIEFVVSWSNNASLKYVTSQRNIPLIHNEKGPLRSPIYFDTAYFDFSGVNGNTESELRYNNFNVVDLLEVDDLRNLFLMDKEISVKNNPIYEIGIALQVEDDSNLIAYGNGYDNLKLLNEIRYFYSYDKILVRNHPLSGIKFLEKYGNIDNSKNSIEFLSKCIKIATINSSLGFEALFWNKYVCAKGDSPYSFFVSTECNNPYFYEDNYLKFLNFFLLAYLIPYDYLFDKEYYKWRIEIRDEKKIFEKHLEYWLMKNNIAVKEECLISRKIYFLAIEEKNAQLEKYKQTIEEKNAQLEKYKQTIEDLLNEVLMYSTSRSWKVTRWLRRLKRMFL